MTKYYTMSFDSFWKIVDQRVYFYMGSKFALIKSIPPHDVIDVAREVSYKYFLLHSN